MKQIITFFRKDTSSVFPHYAYKAFVVLFLGICIYELGQLVIEYYTFFRALIIFLGVSFVYFGYVFHFSSTKRKNMRLLQKKVSLVQKHAYIQSVFRNQETILYILFIAVFVAFLYSFYTAKATVFIYSVYVFVMFLLFCVFTEKRMNVSFQDTFFSTATVLKIGVICTSVYLLLLHSIVDLYGIEHYEKTILFTGGVLFFIGFICIFTDIYKRSIAYIQSRKFRNYMVRNTYNFLSVIFISLTVVLLLGKFWFFKTFQQHFLSSSDESDINTVEVISSVEYSVEPQVIPEKTFETRLISDVYTFSGFSALGSSGSEVIKLQEALSLLGTYESEITWEYDEQTKESLTRTLINSCDWPDTTRGIFGPLAQECLNGLEVQIEI